MAIKDWPTHDRPREKLLAFGPQTLSDSELLAIFLRTGCAGYSAIDLARHLLDQFGSLRKLLECEKQAFCSAKGLGDAKYAQLQAVMEMARRHLAETMQKQNVFLKTDDVRQYLRAHLRHKQHEVFAVLYLDNQHQLLAYDEIFRGTIDGASVHPREVVKSVLRHNAAAIILAHNHPSGVAEPSGSDLDITQLLKDALQLIDVRVLDHFIVGDAEVVSLCERGLL